MEVFFLDVAQGTCQILLIGNRTAIVLDSGAHNGRLPLQFLKRMGIDCLAALLTTHSHNDHMGGATAILGEFQDMIDVVGFVKDDQFLGTDYWARISELVNDGIMKRSQLVRLKCNRDPQIIWNDAEMNASLRVFAPLPIQNLLAEEQGNGNATSAILILDVGQRRIVFGADSELVEWQDIHGRFGTVSCDVLSVPHHGGKVHETQVDLDWLYGQGIDANVAVVSVGTTNTYGHPREDVIRSLTASGAQVMCTQITSRCQHDLEPIRANIVAQKYVGASSEMKQVTNAGHSKNVACAGTIRVELDRNNLAVESLSSHQAAVDQPSTDPTCPLRRLS